MSIEFKNVLRKIASELPQLPAVNATQVQPHEPPELHPFVQMTEDVIRPYAERFKSYINYNPRVKSRVSGFMNNLRRMNNPRVAGTMVDNSLIDASQHIRPEDKQAVRNLREQQRRRWFKTDKLGGTVYTGPKQGPYWDASRMTGAAGTEDKPWW